VIEKQLGASFTLPVFSKKKLINWDPQTVNNYLYIIKYIFYITCIFHDLLQTHEQPQNLNEEQHWRALTCLLPLYFSKKTEELCVNG